MLSKEQIAHDLTMVYMHNMYGIDVTGFFSINDGNGNGKISTEKLPTIDEMYYKKVKTGEIGWFGIEKKKKVPAGYMVDGWLSEMTDVYFQVYTKFYQLVCERAASLEQSQEEN